MPNAPHVLPARREPVADADADDGCSVRGPERPRPANDTWIAACCLVRELPLATLNIKDFTDFTEHEGLVLIS
jgi:predicted nucleic acid-binding protein